MNIAYIKLGLFCCLVCFIEALPIARTEKESLQRSSPMNDNAMYYRLFAQMLSTGSLRNWINQYIVRLSSYDQFSNNKPRTEIPKLTIEGDYNPVVKTTSSASLSGTGVKTTRKLKERVTLPIVRLTGSDTQDIVESSTEGLTVIRDYPQTGPATLLPAYRQKRFVLPLMKIDSEKKYNNPGDEPKTDTLTDGKGDQGELIMVRDQDNSKGTKSVKVTQPTESTDPGPTYNTGSNQGTSGGLNFKIVRCGTRNLQWCFEFVA